MRFGLACVVVATGCGRLYFDPRECSFDVEPSTAQVNLNSRLQLQAVGARGTVRYRIASGQGSIDEAGVLFSGDRVEAVTVDATDDDGCTASAVIDVLGSTLFYVAGADAASTAVAGAWSSTDGIAWQASGSLPAPRSLGKLVVFDDRMWWLGGSGVANVWSTGDGLAWRAEAPLPTGVSEFGSAVYQRRMWVIGGSDGGNFDTVYSTADGITWELTGHLPLPMHGPKCAGFLGRLWCVGGHSAAGRVDRVVSSVDGVTWADEAPLPFIREEQGQIVTADGTLAIIAGSDVAGGQRDGAVTHDGVTWTVTPPLPDTRFITELAQLGDTIYMAGANVSVMASTDGSTWSAVGVLPAYRESGGFVAFTPH